MAVMALLSVPPVPAASPSSNHAVANSEAPVGTHAVQHQPASTTRNSEEDALQRILLLSQQEEESRRDLEKRQEEEFEAALAASLRPPSARQDHRLNVSKLGRVGMVGGRAPQANEPSSSSTKHQSHLGPQQTTPRSISSGSKSVTAALERPSSSGCLAVGLEDLAGWSTGKASMSTALLPDCSKRPSMMSHFGGTPDFLPESPSKTASIQAVSGHRAAMLSGHASSQTPQSKPGTRRGNRKGGLSSSSSTSLLAAASVSLSGPSTLGDNFSATKTTNPF